GRLAIMANAGSPAVVLEMEEIQVTARALGREVTSLEIRRGEDITLAFETLKSGADALYISPDALINTNRTRINTLALGARVPTMSSIREYVAAGTLMSYGANLPDLWRRAAELVDKILRGAKPADIPVEQPTKFDLVINITTAKALGLAIPESFLLRADEVIEGRAASSSGCSAAAPHGHSRRARSSRRCRWWGSSTRYRFMRPGISCAHSTKA